MAISKLKVDELRDELSKRGLSTTGVKPTLLKKLNSAIRKERERENPADGRFQIIRGIDGLRKLKVKELREQASLRGISSSGSKKELLERLRKDSETNFTDIVAEIEEREDTKKGSGILARYISDDEYKAQYHVLQQGSEIYVAKLKQTNIKRNNNKFYIIQALESTDGSTFMLYTRWGRTGYQGRTVLYGPYPWLHSVVYEFEKKFYDKTKNKWSDREQFMSKRNFYTWSKGDYGVPKESDAYENMKRLLAVQLQETKLEKGVAEFISLIFNPRMMEKQMKEIGFSVESWPFHKLSKDMILEGYEVLQRIVHAINEKDTEKLQQLSEEFYTIIPHDVRFKNLGECVIDTTKKLEEKLEMVKSLGEIEVASKLLEAAIEMEEDQLFSCYEQLHCDLTPIDVDSEEFKRIKTYMENTHAKTPPHSYYTVKIVRISKVSRHGEADRYAEFSNEENRMLLWHGSRLSNWVGILSEGLQIAPPSAPASGASMFGKGVYFADVFSKSANYCRKPDKQALDGVVLLCEVALGDMVQLEKANYDGDQLPDGKLSTKGVGAIAPDMIEILEDGVGVPLGRLKQQMKLKPGGLQYNEYVVYNVNQIKMCYVVHVNFIYNEGVYGK